MSTAKLVVMHALTGGLYCYYWFYCQWTAERARTGGLPHPIFFTFWAPLSAFALFKRIQLHGKRVEVSSGYSAGWLFFFFLFALAVRSKVDSPWLLGGLSALPLLPVHATALRINKRHLPDAAASARITRADILILVAVALLTVHRRFSQAAPEEQPRETSEFGD